MALSYRSGVSPPSEGIRSCHRHRWLRTDSPSRTIGAAPAKKKLCTGSTCSSHPSVHKASRRFAQGEMLEKWGDTAGAFPWWLIVERVCDMAAENDGCLPSCASYTERREVLPRMSVGIFFVAPLHFFNASLCFFAFCVDIRFLLLVPVTFEFTPSTASGGHISSIPSPMLLPADLNFSVVVHRQM